MWVIESWPMGKIIARSKPVSSYAPHTMIKPSRSRKCLSFRLQWLTAYYGETLIPETRKTFAVLAEGLYSEKSRGDRTAIELFMPGIRGLGGRIAAILRQVAA
jgi:hypothetical protein